MFGHFRIRAAIPDIRSWMTAAALALSFALVGCIPVPACYTLSAFEEAASYGWKFNDRRYAEPLNAWVRNERLEKFLLRAFQAGGIDALRSQYGFDCTLRPVEPACEDCHVCRGRLSKQVADIEDVWTGAMCRKSGEMLMQVDIGPGPRTFSVMTYWKRPPPRPDAGKY